MSNVSTNLNKVCNLEDFSRPDLIGVLREIFPHDVTRFGDGFPRGREYRKHWEVGMAALALRSGGALHPEAEVLGVGAGNEPTLFWLTRHVRRVFATDLYCASGSWSESANATMLHDPGQHWPGTWNQRRLVVQHMNALELQYEDNTFDGIFSSSSLEHFGTIDDVRRAMREMHRVLKVGGRLSLSTEFRIDGPGPGVPGVLLFSKREIEDVILSDRAWAPASPPDFEVSASTRASETRFADALKDLKRHCRGDRSVAFHRLEWSRYPHVVLREKAHAWTSIHLSLEKRAAA